MDLNANFLVWFIGMLAIAAILFLSLSTLGCRGVALFLLAHAAGLDGYKRSFAEYRKAREEA